jgi:hypothetical protein
LRIFSAVLAAGVLAGCASGPWAWRRADGSVDPQKLREDTAECEAYASTVNRRGGHPSSASARPEGEWGNAAFELCMSQRKWSLVRAPASDPAAPPAGAGPR